jgi:glycerate dehydrogenase
MRAVFLDYDTVSNADLDTATLLRAMPALELYDQTADAEIAERIRDAEVVLLNKLEITRAAIEGAERLRVIAVAGTGTNHIDLAAARDCGVAVYNVRAYCTAGLAQHVWAMILSLTQRLDDYRRIATGGEWASGIETRLLRHPIRELGGRTLGIVGWGELGRAVAKIGEAFGMNIAVANRAGGAREHGRLDLPDLLRGADIVSLHCPLTAATRGLIGTRELANMKNDALLINTARGALIDAAALAAALRAGTLGGAGIDVLAREPPTDGDPLLEPGIPNLIVTPHVGWAAQESRQRCLDELAANVSDFYGEGRRARVV